MNDKQNITEKDKIDKLIDRWKKHLVLNTLVLLEQDITNLVYEEKQRIFKDIEHEIAKIKYEPESDWNNFCVAFLRLKEKELRLDKK
ncbi:MAG: hypothetical protein ACE5KD_00900 [Candidatus Bathyarchaeia archaeon]